MAILVTDFPKKVVEPLTSWYQRPSPATWYFAIAAACQPNGYRAVLPASRLEGSARCGQRRLSRRRATRCLPYVQSRCSSREAVTLWRNEYECSVAQYHSCSACAAHAAAGLRSSLNASVALQAAQTLID
jgi:hypothetical protein